MSHSEQQWSENLHRLNETLTNTDFTSDETQEWPDDVRHLFENVPQSFILQAYGTLSRLGIQLQHGTEHPKIAVFLEKVHNAALAVLPDLETSALTRPEILIAAHYMIEVDDLSASAARKKEHYELLALQRARAWLERTDLIDELSTRIAQRILCQLSTERDELLRVLTNVRTASRAAADVRDTHYYAAFNLDTQEALDEIDAALTLLKPEDSCILYQAKAQALLRHFKISLERWRANEDEDEEDALELLAEATEEKLLDCLETATRLPNTPKTQALIHYILAEFYHEAAMSEERNAHAHTAALLSRESGYENIESLAQQLLQDEE